MAVSYLGRALAEPPAARVQVGRTGGAGACRTTTARGARVPGAARGESADARSSATVRDRVGARAGPVQRDAQPRWASRPRAGAGARSQFVSGGGGAARGCADRRGPRRALGGPRPDCACGVPFRTGQARRGPRPEDARGASDPRRPDRHGGRGLCVAGAPGARRRSATRGLAGLRLRDRRRRDVLERTPRGRRRRARCRDRRGPASRPGSDVHAACDSARRHGVACGGP